MMRRVLFVAAIGIMALTAFQLVDCPTTFHVNGTPLAFAPTTEQKEIVIDETFAVRPGEKLELNVGHSDVMIETGSGSEAHVRVMLTGRNMDRAREFFEHLNFQVEQSGGVVSVITDPRGSWNRNSGDADIDVLITIPEVFDAQVDVSHGDLEVENLKGRLSFNVSHGDMDVGTLSGAMLNVRAAHGDVSANQLGSEKIQVETSHGDFDADDITASDIEIDASHGNVEIESLQGYPRITAQHGDISVHLGSAEGGSFRNSHGDIELTTSGSPAADLDFTAPDIDIASSFEFDGTSARGRLEGRINGGGAKLDAHTTHGEITLRRE